MKLNSMLDNLLDLAKQENEPNRYAHSEEYNKLYNELDTKTLIIDEIEKELGCSLEIVNKALENGIYAKDSLDENKLNYIPSVALSNVGTEWYLSNHCDFCVNVRDYKELFWLKEDRSDK